MRKMWKRFVNLVKRYVPGLRKRNQWGYFKPDGLVIIKGAIKIGEPEKANGKRPKVIIAEELGFEQVQPKKRSEGSAEGWPTSFEVYTYLQKEWKEQESEGLLPKYVAGIDPYKKSGDGSLHIFGTGGELSSHPTERDFSEPGHREKEHNNPDMGGAHSVRRSSDEAPVPGIGNEDA
jgi:hypothetical protein